MRLMRLAVWSLVVSDQLQLIVYTNLLVYLHPRLEEKMLVVRRGSDKFQTSDIHYMDIHQQ